MVFRKIVIVFSGQKYWWSPSIENLEQLIFIWEGRQLMLALVASTYLTLLVQQIKFILVLDKSMYLIDQKKFGPIFRRPWIFVGPNFRHLGPINNLGRRKFGLFLKFHITVKFVLKYNIFSFRLANSHHFL